MRTNYCWVSLPDGTRRYFSDSNLKQANAFAQELADKTRSNVIR